MTEIQAERVKKLYNFLAALPEKRFNLHTIVCGVPNADNIHEHMVESAVDDSDCGTAGCVAGWCPVIFPDDWEYRRYQISRVNSYPQEWIYDLADFFGISPWNIRQIVYPHYYDDPALCNVLARIREYSGLELT